MTSAYASSFTSARIGGGWVHLPKSDSSSVGGTVRIGNEQPAWKTMIGLDLSAFRFVENKGFPSDVNGNAATIVIGSYALGGTIWAGYGAGELRAGKRPPPHEDEPHGFFVQLFEIGMSGDLYESDFGRVEICAAYRHFLPDNKFRKYSGGTDQIDALLFEIGLRLGNW